VYESFFCVEFLVASMAVRGLSSPLFDTWTFLMLFRFTSLFTLTLLFLNLCTSYFNLLFRFSLCVPPYFSLIDLTMLLRRLRHLRFKLTTFDSGLAHYRLGCVKFMITTATIQLVSFCN